MGMLDRAAILAAQDHETEDVVVPEWGGVVRLRTLTAGERDAWDAALWEVKGREITRNVTHLRARLVVACAVDAHGRPLFSAADIPALSAKSGAVLDRLYAVAERLNHLTAAAVETLAGNSGPGQADGSSSSSPVSSG